MLSDHFLIVVKPTNSGIPTYLLLRQALGGKLALVLCLAPGGKLRCAVWRTPVPPPLLPHVRTAAATATRAQTETLHRNLQSVPLSRSFSLSSGVQCPGCFHEFCMCHILHYYIVFRTLCCSVYFSAVRIG